MALQATRLTRRTINRICDAILPVPSLDPVASENYTSLMRERVRNQLVDADMVQTEEAIQLLIDYWIAKQKLAFLEDDINVGLPASEAASAALAQTAMSAFKATSHDVSLATIVNQLSSVLSTVADRSDQKVIVHFDPEYSSDGINYSLREIVDMRAIFVRTNLNDIIFMDKTTIGVLEPFEGDGLSEAANRIKVDFQEESYCEVLKPGRWNKIRAMKPGGTGIVCMRIYLDPQLIYSRGISILTIIEKISEVMKEIDCSVTASGLQEGIVDILASSVEKELIYVVNIFEKTKRMFQLVEMSGIPSVNSMSLDRVSVNGLITSSKRANEYHVSQLGMNAWFLDLGEDRLSWADLDNESYLVNEEQLAGLEQGTYYFIGIVDDGRSCIYFPDYGGDHATSEELTQLYINYYCKKLGVRSLENVWVLSLDVIAMKVSCVHMELLIRLLKYCGLEALRQEYSRTCELVEYLYLESVEDPDLIVKRHFNPKTYENFDPERSRLEQGDQVVLSETAKRRVTRLVRDKPAALRANILKNIENEFLNRMSKYYFAILSVAKKADTKIKGPVVPLVFPHTYAEILRFPFVDRSKTTCNDWHTMNYVLGADAARNNYIREPVELFQGCDIKIDPRHIDLIGDYVFERGSPSGVGLSAMSRHGIGFTHEMSTQKTYSQLYSGHMRGEEPIESYSVSAFLGSPPVGPGTKAREVERAKRLEELERSKYTHKYGQEKAVVVRTKGPAQNSDAVNIAVRSMFLDTNPYYGLPTFKLEGVIAPPRPTDFIVLGDVVPSRSRHYSAKIMDIVRSKVVLDSIVERLSLLKEYTGHIKKVVAMTESSNLLDMSLLYAFFTENSSTFSSL